MRLALFVFLSCSVATLAYGQRGGHGGGGGARGGGGVSHASGGVSRGVSGGGLRAGSAYRGGYGYRGGYRGNYGYRFYGPRYYGWPYLYGGYGYGYYDPSFWGDDYYDNSNGYGYAGAPYGYTNNSDWYPAPNYAYAPQQPPPPPMVIAAAPQPPQNVSRAAGDTPSFLIAFNDHNIKLVAAYWTEKSSLKYVTMEHEIKTVPLADVDRDLSRRLNQERGVQFALPASKG